MKKIGLLLVMLFTTVIVFGQRPNRGDGERPERNKEQMGQYRKQQRQTIKDSLYLNDEQAVKFDSIDAKYDKQVEEIFAKGQRENARSQMENIENARDTEILLLLTKEQQKKYKKMKKELDKERKGGGQQRGSGPPRGRGRM